MQAWARCVGGNPLGLGVSLRPDPACSNFFGGAPARGESLRSVVPRSSASLACERLDSFDAPVRRLYPRLAGGQFADGVQARQRTPGSRDVGELTSSSADRVIPQRGPLFLTPPVDPPMRDAAGIRRRPSSWDLSSLLRAKLGLTDVLAARALETRSCCPTWHRCGVGPIRLAIDQHPEGFCDCDSLARLGPAGSGAKESEAPRLRRGRRSRRPSGRCARNRRRGHGASQGDRGRW